MIWEQIRKHILDTRGTNGQSDIKKHITYIDRVLDNLPVSEPSVGIFISPNGDNIYCEVESFTLSN